MKNQRGPAPGTFFNGEYTPIRDWNMQVGARVSEERIQQLMNFEFDDYFDLTEDDIFACNNRKMQAMLWLFAAVAEKLWGEEKAFKLYWEAGHMVGTKGWKGMCNRFKTDKITPAQYSWYQDMAHFFYGPHCTAYTEYTEDTVVVTRQDCLVSRPPAGMEAQNKYVAPFIEGYIQAYVDLAPYITVKFYPFVTEEDMPYKVDLTKYPSFMAGKRAGQPFSQFVTKWIK
jgi:hypothetical protein